MKSFRLASLVPRFALRTLLLLVTLAAMGFAFWTRYVAPYREEARIGQLLTRTGHFCRMKYAPAEEVPVWLRRHFPNWFQHVTEIDFGASAAEVPKLNESLVLAKEFPHLKGLDVNGCFDQETLRLFAELNQVDQARLWLSPTVGMPIDWSVLGHWSNLRELYLLDAPYVDDDMKFLGQLSELRVLSLGNELLTGKCLEFLPPNSRLTTLAIGFLKNSNLSANISRLSRLKTLNLSMLTLDRFDLADTPAAKSLEAVVLHRVNLPDDVMISIIRLPRLRSLQIVEMKINEPIIAALKESPTLEELELNCNGIPPETVRPLRRNIKNVYFIPSIGYEALDF